MITVVATGTAGTLSDKRIVVATESVVIIGGGMTGLIAQQYVPEALILDWGPQPMLVENAPRILPKQWGAIYWWKPIAGLACEEFEVLTTIDNQRATPELIQAYKARVGKAHEVYSRPGMIDAQFAPTSVGYAPVEFPSPTRIQYKAHVIGIDPFRQQVHLRTGENVTYERLISTIPLPALRGMVDAASLAPFDVLHFKSAPIFVIEKKETFRPRPMMSVDYRTYGDVYRATAHRDGALHLEYQEAPRGAVAKKLIPGRIYDVPHTRALIGELARMNIFCFGRYARWDSDELLHQTDADLKVWAVQQGLCPA